jgi:glycosyltransferase involved in cell wall biosynthesis
MKILVAHAFPVDSKYANVTNTVKMADGFAKNGHDVTVVCRESSITPMDDEMLREKFHLSNKVSFIQTSSKRFFMPLPTTEAFAKQVIEIARAIKPDFAYCRSFIAPIKLAESGVPTVAESHAHIGNTSRPLLALVKSLKENKELRGLVTIGEALKENFVSLGVPLQKVMVLPDAVDIELFTRPKKYNRSLRQRPLITYSGHLYDYKGIPTVLHAALKTPEWDYRLVGGHEKDIERIENYCKSKGISNVSLVGFVPHKEVPMYLWDADILLLPPSAHHPSARWTSPVKLGEYLASGTPVVATAIPALKFWLRENEVFFVQPDSPVDLIKGVKKVLNNTADTLKMIEKAYCWAMKISYQKRCGSVLKWYGPSFKDTW